MKPSKEAELLKGELAEGTVVRQDARGVLVLQDGGVESWCTVRGRVHLEGPTAATTTVAVGDRVRVRLYPGGKDAVELILPRRSVLSRPEPEQGRRKRVLRQKVLAANVDQVVIVTSAADPVFAPFFVDRVLAAAEWSRLTGLVVVNKRDLVDADPVECLVWRKLGYGVLVTSIVSGLGIEALRAALAGRVSVVTGHSGVGKSSLLNAVAPGFALGVGDVNAVTGRGTQTTTSGVWKPLSGGGAVVDTPGVREFGLYNVPEREVTWLFPDLAAVTSHCRFGDCRHREEPGCAVPAALASGELAPWRFESYCRLLGSRSDVASWSVPENRSSRGRKPE